MTTRQDLQAALVEVGLARLANALVARAEDCIRLDRTLLEDAHMPIGASKFGGAPDLPPGTRWPQGEELPLSFLLQLDLADAAALPAARDLPLDGQLSFLPHMDLADAAALPVARDLPPDGLLSLFFEIEAAQRASWLEGRGDSPSWRLLYTPAGTRLERLTLPDVLATRPPIYSELSGHRYLTYPEALAFNTAAIHLSSDLSWPGPWDRGCEDLDWSDVEREVYFTNFRLPPPGEYRHRLLGLWDVIQNDELAPDMEAERDAWRLLLQIDSDDDIGTIWGDVGLLYVWIRRADLVARDFSHVRLLDQYT